MRHLIGLVLALAAAAAVFFGGGWAVARILTAHAHGASLTNMSGGLTLAALLGTGLFLGLLVAVPISSPVGAGLPGLVLLAWSGLEFFKAHWAMRLIPVSGFDANAASGFKTMLTAGVLALIGMVLIVPIFVPSRWRRREPADEFASVPEAELVH